MFFHSRSREFLGMIASDSHSRIVGMDFFSFPSRSRIVGMDFFSFQHRSRTVGVDFFNPRRSRICPLTDGAIVTGIEILREMPNFQYF